MLTIAYDGTDFAGWQIQSKQRTVQAVVQGALCQISDRPIQVRAAGRTDSGVHAIGQIVNFWAGVSFPVERWTPAVNTHLPPDVRVLSSKAVKRDFDARNSALARAYYYQILTQPFGMPHLRRYCYQVGQNLDLGFLNEAASYLIGEHDFTVFAKKGDSSRSKVRRIISAEFYHQTPFIIFRIVGTSFLWRMVRSIVGTLIEFANIGASASDVGRLISGRTRADTGKTAPARGLFLEKVWYPGSLTHDT